MKISVIIPTFRPESYLFECLDSLRKQTLHADLFEILLILNGKKQPYYKDIDQYIRGVSAGQDIKCIYTESAGVSHARNIGIQYAAGTYIAFIDDDDIISPQYLEILLETAEQGYVPAAKVLNFKNSIAETTDNYLTVCYERNAGGEPCSHFKMRSYLSCVYAKLIKQEYIAGMQFDIRFSQGEDALFMFGLSRRLPNIKTVPEAAVYYYRIRPDSLSHKRTVFSIRLRKYIELIFAYIVVFIKQPSRCSVPLFLSRIAAVILHIVRK